MSDVPRRVDTYGVKNKKKKSKWKIVISIVALIGIAAVGISAYVGHSMTHPDKKPIDQFPDEYGMDYEDVEFVSRDGETNLKGWVIEPEKDAKMTVIFSHGYKGNRFEDHVSFLDMAKDLHDKKYRILMFDFRYSGESEGEMTTIGAKEQLDLLGAIDYMEETYDEPDSLLGISMGAATSLLAAAQSDVISVVADSPFSDLEEYLKENLPVWSNLPSIPFTPLILNIVPKMTDLDPKEASPISVLEDIAPRPILFIHNKGDESIPYFESQKMHDEYPKYFQIWLPDGVGHVTAYKQNKEDYIEKVEDFFKI